MKAGKDQQAIVFRPSEMRSHDRGGGATTIPLVAPSTGSTSFINGITTFAPGTAIGFHSHNCEESVIVLEGEALLELENEAIPLRPLDTTWIPANMPHCFRNASAIEPMKIFWTYARLARREPWSQPGKPDLYWQSTPGNRYTCRNRNERRRQNPPFHSS